MAYKFDGILLCNISTKYLQLTWFELFSSSSLWLSAFYLIWLFRFKVALLFCSDYRLGNFLSFSVLYSVSGLFPFDEIFPPHGLRPPPLRPPGPRLRPPVSPCWWLLCQLVSVTSLLELNWHWHLCVNSNSVQEAWAKCFTVHILGFEILQITWKKWNKEHQTLRFQFFIKNLAFWCFLFCFFHVVCKISNSNMWTEKQLAQASCTELLLTHKCQCQFSSKSEVTLTNFLWKC